MALPFPVKSSLYYPTEVTIYLDEIKQATMEYIVLTFVEDAMLTARDNIYIYGTELINRYRTNQLLDLPRCSFLLRDLLRLTHLPSLPIFYLKQNIPVEIYRK